MTLSQTKQKIAEWVEKEKVHKDGTPINAFDESALHRAITFGLELAKEAMEEIVKDAAQAANYTQRMKMRWWEKRRQRGVVHVEEEILDEIFLLTFDEQNIRLDQAKAEGAERVVRAVEGSQYPNGNLAAWNGQVAVAAARQALIEVKGERTI